MNKVETPQEMDNDKSKHAEANDAENGTKPRERLAQTPGHQVCRSYRENVSMIASAIASAFSSSAKWLASK
jgi:hypothetical protein